MSSVEAIQQWVQGGCAVDAELTGRLQVADEMLRPLGDPRPRRTRRGAEQDRPEVSSAYRAALASADQATVRAAALWAHQIVCTSAWPADVSTVRDLARDLARMPLAWTSQEVDLAVRLTVVVPWNDWYLKEIAALPIAAAGTLATADVIALSPVLRALRQHIAESHLPAEDRLRLRRQLDEILDRPARATGAFPPSLLHDGDGLGPALRAEIGHRLGAPGVAALFVHAAKASGPRPPVRWRTTARTLLDEAADGATVVRSVLERTSRHREHAGECRCGVPGHVDWVWLHESTARLVRGLVVLAGDSTEDWVTPVLGELLVVAGSGLGGHAPTPRDLVVANAVIAVLAGREDAVPHLARAQTRIRHRALTKGVSAALEVAAERAGVTVGQLAERTVPTYGLDACGRHEEELGEHTAVLALQESGAVTLSFRSSRRDLAGVPAAVRSAFADDLTRLRATVKDLKRTLASERFRIEEVLSEDRAWSFGEWAEHYRDHPVVGVLTRGLLWQVKSDDGWRTGQLTPARQLVDLAGAPLPVGAAVRLWHPLRAERDEVQAWREKLFADEVRQPFKQAFREIYRLTDAELETADHSNRFAAHILKAPQAQALMRTRGWAGNGLGYWDGGYEGHVTKPFEGGWRAEFFYDLVEDPADGYGTPSLASSDQVRFSRQGDGAWAARPLEEVPPLVFTEAMRDVDLFVGVTSIASDPTWITRGARTTHEDYWQQMSFGALSEAAASRREALERLVPRLRIADRCMLTERFLEVRGNLRTYKVHLGSGNILMAPDDEYLCIVPGRDRHRDHKVFLPFEEDGGMLSVILSKAFLLADDTAITDTSITSQMKRVRR